MKLIFSAFWTFLVKYKNWDLTAQNTGSSLPLYYSIAVSQIFIVVLQLPPFMFYLLSDKVFTSVVVFEHS